MTLLLPFLSILAGGELVGYGGIGITATTAVLVGVVACLVLIINLTSLVRQRRTIGGRYVGLRVVAKSGWRLVAARVLMLLAPLVVADIVYTQASATEVFWYALLAIYALDWLAWLGPSQRTLGDRLAGARFERAGATDAGAMNGAERLSTGAVLLAPALLSLPWFACFRGGIYGSLAALFAQAVPTLLLRRR